MTDRHTRWERDPGRAENPHYTEARRRHLISQAVYDRRVALGLSQVELAHRAKITQAALSRIELGGSTPTLTTLDRLAAALDADLVVAIAPHAA